MNKKYTKPRAKISTDLQRQVKIEAGHKCVVNRCNSTTCEIHHIDGNRENNNLENLVYLCRNHHKQAHEGKIDKKALLEYKNRNFINDDEIITFYQKHIDELTTKLNLKNWDSISYDLSAGRWQITSKNLEGFEYVIDIIDRTDYPQRYSEIRDSLLELKTSLYRVISHFRGDKIEFIEPYFMYERWKKDWYDPDEYDKRYKEMEIWQDKLGDLHNDLVKCLNSLSKIVQENIKPDYMNRRRFKRICNAL